MDVPYCAHSDDSVERGAGIGAGSGSGNGNGDGRGNGLVAL